jgi:hypothetical protein
VLAEERRRAAKQRLGAAAGRRGAGLRSSGWEQRLGGGAQAARAAAGIEGSGWERGKRKR